MRKLLTGVSAYAASLLAGAAAFLVCADATNAQTAAPGYSITTFGAAPAGATGADSVLVIGNNVYVGYGNGVAKDGSDGKSSTIAEFSSSGALLGTTSVVGHNDGLRYDAATNQIWSLQNEDANTNLVLITPGTLAQSPAINLTSVNGGGGFDDAVFMRGNAYLSASNPFLNPNTSPAIVSATINGGTSVSTTPVLLGNAAATPLNTGAPSTLNLQDPDSLSQTIDQRVVLTSQADGQLVFIKNIGKANQSVSVLQLNNALADDTAFGGTNGDTLLVADKTTNKIYAIIGPFKPNFGYSAAQDALGQNGFIGAFDASNFSDGGNLTPIVTGLGDPGGEAFLDPPAVPEPATWAMLLLGFAGLTFAFRQSRRRVSLA